MIRLVALSALLLTGACKYRDAEAVQDYPDVYLCQLNDGLKKTENAAEREAVAGEVRRRGLECYQGTVKTDSPLFR